MLSFLTGNIQTGKTRWLLRHIDELEADGVPICGVVAPGTWIDHGESAPGERYEKTGIDNLLLPTREIVPFARRNDLAQAAGSFDAHSQAAQAQLRWAIDDAAIDRVNAHFAALAKLDDDAHRLMVIDEFGILELQRNEGLTQAVVLVDRGATPAITDALIVVREPLLACAQERFAAAKWGGMNVLRPV